MSEGITPVCGCVFAPGREIGYGQIRSHFDHVSHYLDKMAASVLMLQLTVRVNHDMDSNVAVAKVLHKILEAKELYDTEARPALDRLLPPNPIAEAPSSK